MNDDGNPARDTAARVAAIREITVEQQPGT